MLVSDLHLFSASSAKDGCSACNGTGSITGVRVEIRGSQRIHPPRCPKCGGTGRPFVLAFPPNDTEGGARPVVAVTLHRSHSLQGITEAQGWAAVDGIQDAGKYELSLAKD